MNALEEVEWQLRAGVAARALHPSAPVGRPAKRVRIQPGWIGRRRLSQTGTVAGAAAVIVLVLVLATTGAGPGPSPALAATLQRLAKIAVGGPSLVPGQGQYLYVASVDYYSANVIGRGGIDCITYLLDHRQVWKAADGSGLLRDTTGPGSYTSNGDQSVCRSMHIQAATATETSNT